MKGLVLMVALNPENILTLGGLAIGEEYWIMSWLLLQDRTLRKKLEPFSVI
jgi:hypothetical protein